MKIKEIREKNKNELKKELGALRNKLTKLRFDISGKQLKNHREIRKIKKDIAKILTHLSLGFGRTSPKSPATERGQAVLKKD